jgi:hypothetical protein
MSDYNSNLSQDLIENIRFFNPKQLAIDLLNHNNIEELVNFCLHDNFLISSKASWVLSHCNDLDYKAVVPFYVKLINNLKNKNLHKGVIRNTLRLFQKELVPKKQESFMLDICYEYIQNPNQAIAVRAFAMTIIYNISKPYPELLIELKAILQLINHPEESPGIKSRIKNTLKDIEQTLNNQ